jgi:hypothetical protein
MFERNIVEQRVLAFHHFEGRQVYVTSAGSASCSEIRSVNCGAAGPSDDKAQQGGKGLENRKWRTVQKKINQIYKYVGKSLTKNKLETARGKKTKIIIYETKEKVGIKEQLKKEEKFVMEEAKCY